MKPGVVSHFKLFNMTLPLSITTQLGQPILQKAWPLFFRVIICLMSIYHGMLKVKILVSYAINKSLYSAVPPGQANSLLPSPWNSLFPVKQMTCFNRRIGFLSGVLLFNNFPDKRCYLLNNNVIKDHYYFMR